MRFPHLFREFGRLFWAFFRKRTFSPPALIIVPVHSQGGTLVGMVFWDRRIKALLQLLSDPRFTMFLDTFERKIESIYREKLAFTQINRLDDPNCQTAP